MIEFDLPHHVVGISVKSAYYDHLINPISEVNFCEAHIENFIAGGYHLAHLRRIAGQVPISLHGVSLSLGGFISPSDDMLSIRKKIIDIIKPVFVSEHASCSFYGQHLNDLLPISFSKKTIFRLVQHIDKVQSYFKRQILIENITSYVTFVDDDMSEAEFLNQVAEKSGCGLLLDVNNLYIQEFNLGRSAQDFIKYIKPHYVQQYHLAGGEYNEKHAMIIDTHSTDISPEVLNLYRQAIDIIGIKPTLYERDNNIPAFEELIKTVKNIREIHDKKMI